MPPEEAHQGTPQEWLRRAQSNLALATLPKPTNALWEDLCFECQQAAEKAAKAVLVFRRIEFPKTHDIRALLTLLDQTEHEVPPDIWDAVDLTDYAVETRYPGRVESVTEEEFRQALALADRVVGWAAETLSVGA